MGAKNDRVPEGRQRDAETEILMTIEPVFLSQNEAKRFLADTIAREADLSGVPLSEAEKRLLLYSVDDPASQEGVPDEDSDDNDLEFEDRMRHLSERAYNRAKEHPEKQKKIIAAIRELDRGDHYISIMTATTLKRAHQLRDLALYLLIAISFVVGMFFYWSRKY